MESDAKLAELAARVRKLEDAREISELWWKWHYDCTGGFNGKEAGRMEALECLSDDAEIDLSQGGSGVGPKGREQYTPFWAYFYGDAGPAPYVFQTNAAEKIEVDGDTAVQKSVMLIIQELRGQKPRLFISNRINRLARTPEGWRITYTNIEDAIWVNFDELHGNLNVLPPAEPRTPHFYKE